MWAREGKGGEGETTRGARGAERRLFCWRIGANQARPLEPISHLALKQVVDSTHAEACKANGDGDDAQRHHCRERHDDARAALGSDPDALSFYFVAGGEGRSVSAWSTNMILRTLNKRGPAHSGNRRRQAT